VGSDVEVIVHAVLFPLRALRVLRGEIACAEIAFALLQRARCPVVPFVCFVVKLLVLK